MYGRLTNNNNKCADDDIAAPNKLLEITGVDLDKGTKADKTGASQGKEEITEEDKILYQVLVTFLHPDSITQLRTEVQFHTEALSAGDEMCGVSAGHFYITSLHFPTPHYMKLYLKSTQ